MATYQELRARSQQVRDEQNIGGNTALRVGQLLMDIVKYFNDNDAAASEYLQQHFAMVNDGTQLLNWQQSPIVILHTMGETYDEGDFSALSQGENYYRAGFILEANGQGGGINGETPKANVLYVNLANDTLYTWNGASFDAITSGGGGGSISGDDIIKNAYYSNGNLVLIIETESGDKTVTIPVNFDASNYVPTSRTVNGKALSNNITLSQSDIPGLVAALAGKISGIKTSDNTPLTPDSNGIVTLPPAGSTISPATAAPIMDGTANVGSSAKYAREDHVHPHDTSKLSKSDISVETQGDGTVYINVKDDTYTINLNHTHEGMARLVKCTEATLPQTMADDTIYVQVDNLTTPTEIEALHIFGLEFTGGGLPAGTPQITSPKSTIPFNLGTAYGQGGATGTVQVKGKNLTANSSLTVSVSSGFSLSYGQQSGSSITISAADATIGADVDVFATAYGTSGTLLITSQTDNINHSVELTSDTTVDLLAVKLTGTQWLQTDYRPNAATEFVLNCKFSENNMTRVYPNNDLGTIFHCNNNSSDGKRFLMMFGSNAPNYYTGSFMLTFVNESSSKNGSIYQQIKYSDTPASNQTNFCVDNSEVSYSIQSSNGLFQFSNAATTKSVNTSKKSSAMDNDMKIGYDGTNIMKVFDLTIYELKIIEGGTVVRDWVPKKKNGVTGLLDIATNGTGTFISSETNTELVAIPLT